MRVVYSSTTWERASEAETSERWSLELVLERRPPSPPSRPFPSGTAPPFRIFHAVRIVRHGIRLNQIHTKSSPISNKKKTKYKNFLFREIMNFTNSTFFLLEQNSSRVVRQRPKILSPIFAPLHAPECYERADQLSPFYAGHFLIHSNIIIFKAAYFCFLYQLEK